MIRRANPSRLQPPPPPTQAESAGRSNSISYGYKVQDAFMVPFGTHQENVKRRCQGTVGLAEATQSKKTPPQSQPPGRGSQSPADQTGCCDFRPASIPSRAGSSQHPSIPSASGQTRRQPRGRAQGPAGGHFASRPPSPASAARTRTVGSASPPDAAAPYLPQHFPAVGAEQVVGRGRRAAASAGGSRRSTGSDIKHANKNSGSSQITGVGTAVLLIYKVAYATFLSYALTHWSNGYAILPDVRSCKEAFSDEKARKPPRRGFAPFNRPEGARRFL